MKQLIISDKVQKEMLTDFMIMRETKGLNEQKDRKMDKKKRQEKKIMFEHFSTYHVTFCTAFCLCIGNKK